MSQNGDLQNEQKQNNSLTYPSDTTVNVYSTWGKHFTPKCDTSRTTFFFSSKCFSTVQ